MNVNEILILAAVFTAVLMLSFSTITALTRRRDIERNIKSGYSSRKTDDEIDEMLGSGNDHLRYYLDVVKNAGQNSLRMRLVQAGYFSRSAIRTFNLIRFLLAFSIFLAVQFLGARFFPSASTTALYALGGVLGGCGFIFSSWYLERLGERRMREFRKLFPDFMDLLLVCVDAGLSIDAAIDRVTREFLQTVPDFGVQLSIVNLEMRAGRSLHEALGNFSDRVRVEEARVLAVLFRQSQELGADVSRTLRSFAREMRQMRIIKAEEKANQLPIKMLFPMALFMFPVSLVIVLVPILMTILGLLLQMSPV